MKLTKKLGLAALLLTTASPALALEEGKLLIWMGGDKGDALLQEVVAQFTADLGVEVVVEVADPLTDKFQQAAATGDGPDIVLWAHDRFGEWAAGGLIQPVEPSQEMTDGILASAWDAVSFGGKVWGYPVNVEAIGLVYNKDLIDTPPATFEEIKDLAMPEGVRAILWDYNNTYFTMPMLMANGGFAFQKVDGVVDAVPWRSGLRDQRGDPEQGPRDRASRELHPDGRRPCRLECQRQPRRSG
jgi:maltose/maltodextrin transport system substrate-binding protein